MREQNREIVTNDTKEEMKKVEQEMCEREEVIIIRIINNILQL